MCQLLKEGDLITDKILISYEELLFEGILTVDIIDWGNQDNIKPNNILWDSGKMSIINRRKDQQSISGQHSFFVLFCFSLVSRSFFQGISDLHLTYRSLQTPYIINYQKNQ